MNVASAPIRPPLINTRVRQRLGSVPGATYGTICLTAVGALQWRMPARARIRKTHLHPSVMRPVHGRVLIFARSGGSILQEGGPKSEDNDYRTFRRRTHRRHSGRVCEGCIK
jgi:hypothetical protein